MKLLKYLSLFMVIFSLVACGGHGFEGQYEKRVGSDEKFLNALAGLAGSETIKIGRDFIEVNGVREKFNKIFVRQSGQERFLVFQNGSNEKAWKIIDDDTLMQGSGLVNIQLIRIKKPQ